MATLTTAQQAIFKSALFAETNSELVGYRANGQTSLIRDWYNSPMATSPFIVNRPLTPVAEIINAIIWANFTPANPVSGAGSDVTNWLLACQGKQFNLQMILGSAQGGIGGSGIATDKQNILDGLQDATTNIPSGTNGATKPGGWTSIKATIQRSASNFEKLFATGTGTTASPGTVVLTNVTEADVIFALNN